MYKFLPPNEKVRLIKQVLGGQKVAKVCRQAGISRTVFYKWLAEYKKSNSKRKNLIFLSKRGKGVKHWRKLGRNSERKIINISLKNPSYSAKTISKLTNSSVGFVWKVLKTNNFNTKAERLLYRERNGCSLVRVQPASSKITMIRRFEAGEKISQICKDFGVSRTVFYRWLKRYIEAKDTDALESFRPRGERHWRFIPGIPELIIDVVLKNPSYSSRKINRVLGQMNGKRLVCDTQVYNLLKRLNLNTYQRRLAYANSQPQVSVQQEKALGWRLPGFIKFQFISDISPPVAFSAVASVFVFFFLFFIVKTFSQGFGITYTIGSVFSLLSLLFGMFFFLYSLKYYLTIAVVLSFSRQNQDEEEREKGSFFSRLFGISIHTEGSKAQKKEGRFAGFGLQPDLSQIVLERNPFVSIHLATYNEKRVVDRLLTAATSMDYRNYEIIVADDSNDETVDLLDKWAKHPNVKILHRKSREGYKGGALKEALKVTNPKAEFIMIFDADFIPYPDTIVQFLKYFQNAASGLDSASIKKTNIGAIQGYQWHVLNKSENWITRGVRSEYSGSYVIERSGEEIYSGLKQISGSVYMIRANVLKELGWGTSITEDFELTLRLYEKGYKVVYTPYIQAPAEAVSTIKRLIRQRMRWAEGHSFNVKLMFTRLLFSKNLTKSEKFEFLYLTPYYLQALLFILGTFFWLIAEVVFKVRLPFWTEVWGWSLVFTNLFALPLMNMVGLFLEESEEKDYLGLFSFIALSYIVAPFQAYAAFKGFTEKHEGPWFRTPKTGRITDIFTPGRFYRKIFGIFGRPSAAPVMQAIDSRYLALATANNTFDSFKIRPKKVRWIGRLTLVIFLLITTNLFYFSRFVPKVEAATDTLYFDSTTSARNANAMQLITTTPTNAENTTPNVTPGRNETDRWRQWTPAGGGSSLSSAPTTLNANAWILDTSKSADTYDAGSWTFNVRTGGTTTGSCVGNLYVVVGKTDGTNFTTFFSGDVGSATDICADGTATYSGLAIVSGCNGANDCTFDATQKYLIINFYLHITAKSSSNGTTVTFNVAQAPAGCSSTTCPNVATTDFLPENLWWAFLLMPVVIPIVIRRLRNKEKVVQIKRKYIL